MIPARLVREAPFLKHFWSDILTSRRRWQTAMDCSLQADLLDLADCEIVINDVTYMNREFMWPVECRVVPQKEWPLPWGQWLAPS
jgi:hypothetical protein